MNARQRRLRDLYLARHRIDVEIHRLAPKPPPGQPIPHEPEPWIVEVLADAQRVLAELQAEKWREAPSAEPEPIRRGFELEEWLHLVEGGEDPSEAAARCGVTVEAVYTRARRTGREDVLQLLERRRKVAA